MDYSIAQLFKTLVDQGGSDLHLTVNSPPRIRIDGQLIPLKLPPLTRQDCLELCYSVLNEEQRKTFEKNQEIDLAFNVKNLARFRANIFMESNNIAGAFRVICDNIRSFKELGLPEIVKRLCGLPRGLILVTGPTGSGKSTTLAAMIDHINQSCFERIVTIEDPVEVIHRHKNCMISQREVGEDTHGFKAALKSVLRQDPDVVMIGELRDLETIESAMTIAETGHLVFSTLHTNDCVSTISRIIDAYPPHQQAQIRSQLSMTLEAVLSQILVPTIKGGRVMALELMLATPPIRALVAEAKYNQIYSAIQTGQKTSGMQTMNQSLFKYVKSGNISKEIALSKSSYAEELHQMFVKNTIYR